MWDYYSNQVKKHLQWFEWQKGEGLVKLMEPSAQVSENEAVIAKLLYFKGIK